MPIDTIQKNIYHQRINTVIGYVRENLDTEVASIHFRCIGG